MRGPLRVPRRVSLALFWLTLAAGTLGAQSGAGRQVATSDTTVPRPNRGVLARTISVELADVPLESALRQLASIGGVRLSYSVDVLPTDQRVTLAVDRIALGDAFREALRQTDLDVVVSPAGYVIVVRSPWSKSSPLPPVADSSARPVETPVLRPASRPQVMDRILVMGTPASGAPERSLASAVTVLTSAHLAQHGLTNMSQMFRSSIPGIVAWDLGIAGPFAQLGSVRGSSSFSANYLKTYVDGVELASSYLLFALDPFSIERIEVIRGPQGSALYGSDAISGVVQVITRKGTPAAKWRPQVDAATSLGRMESDFTTAPTSRQRHSAMAFTGGGTTSFGVGGTFEDVGAIVPGGTAGYVGTYGGGRTLIGPLRLESSARYAEVTFTAPTNPLFGGTQIPANIRPLLETQRIENETYGVTADFQPAGWFRQTLVLGIDRHAGSIPPQREPATVADALLGATREHVQKRSMRYAMAFRAASPDEGTAFTATLGWERALLARERLGFRYDLVGVGSGLAALYKDDIDNTGVFGQLKLDVENTLFVTAGLRGERNSSFGQAYGTAYAPMVGVAVTRDLGEATLKVRSAYGKGLRPPQPSMRRAIQTVGFRQLANPDLEPEAQTGTEAGLELYLGDRLNVSVTAYNQNAEGLIQQVVANPRVNARTIQYQNVGRIHNRGIELEGSARFGFVRGDLSFALTNSRVAALSPTYSGDLAVGDRVPEVPSSSGLASLTAEYSRVRATFGATYVGSWTGYDWLTYYGADLGTAASRPLLRNYWINYPSLTKPYAALSYIIGRSIESYVRVDNLSNVQRNERDNLQITSGRTATIGLRFVR
jgi:iron complex outermembrane receptor protein